jgi:hypothetical protein
MSKKNQIVQYLEKTCNELEEAINYDKAHYEQERDSKINELSEFVSRVSNSIPSSLDDFVDYREPHWLTYSIQSTLLFEYLELGNEEAGAILFWHFDNLAESVKTQLQKKRNE